MHALLLCIALSLLSALPVSGADLLILQGARGPAYGEALRAFHAACHESHETVVLSDYAEVNVPRLVREERPKLVVAVGDKALAAAREVHEVPVLALLAPSLNLRKKLPENVGGVAMVASPEQYLKLMSSMGFKRVGVVYDRKKTGYYLGRAARESRRLGLTLVAEPLLDSRELQLKLQNMKDRVDVLWMLPDSTVVTKVNLEGIVVFSMTNKVPVISFSSEYLKLGVAAALQPEFAAMGRQAGEIANSIIGGARVSTVDPDTPDVFTNEPALLKLGVHPAKVRP